MKRFFYACLAAFAFAGIVMSCQVAAHNAAGRDWKREMALAGNDLTKMLKYQPTDGASQDGKVRKAMDPSNIQP